MANEGRHINKIHSFETYVPFFITYSVLYCVRFRRRLEMEPQESIEEQSHKRYVKSLSRKQAMLSILYFSSSRTDTLSYDRTLTI